MWKWNDQVNDVSDVVSVCCEQERADNDVIETQLFVRRVTVDSFRRYTLVAENAVGPRTHHVRFVRSKHSTPTYYHFTFTLQYL